MHAKLLLSCPTLCDPMDHSPPDSYVHGILQVRILEWVAMPSSRESSQPKDQTRVSNLLQWRVGSSPLAPPGKTHLPYRVSVVYTCQFQCPNPPHSTFPPWCPNIYSLHLCLYFCFASKSSYTIFSRFHR